MNNPHPKDIPEPLPEVICHDLELKALHDCRAAISRVLSLTESPADKLRICMNLAANLTVDAINMGLAYTSPDYSQESLVAADLASIMKAVAAYYKKHPNERDDMQQRGLNR